MNKPLRLALDVLAEVESGACGPSLQRRAGEARALLQRRKRPTKTMPESVKVKEKVSAEREKREDKRCREQYEAVIVRSGDRCELTGMAAHPVDPLVTHHIFYGRGVDRDSVTWAHLMIRLRDSIHKAIHHDPTTWEDEMRLWAARHGFVNAREEIIRRCERARASRAAEKEDA